jgi:hypothetical protein
LIRKAGYTKATAMTGAVTLIQCFGGTLNLNIHYHMALVPLYHETGGIHETPCINPQWSGALRVENTLAQWNNACYFRAAGFYVQDVRYAAGAWMHTTAGMQEVEQE